MSRASVRPTCPKPSSTTATRSGGLTRAAADLGQLEGIVDAALRLGGVALLDDERDVELRRSLRDRHDVDARRGPARRRPGPRRRARPPCRDRPRPRSPCRGAPPRRRCPAARSPPGTRAAAPPRPAPACASGTLNVSDASDEPCVTSDTGKPARCSVSKVRAATPGTPSIPLPVTVISACAPMPDTARTGDGVRRRCCDTSVPCDAGLANGRTYTGIGRRLSGMSARGCSTLAP